MKHTTVKTINDEDGPFTDKLEVEFKKKFKFSIELEGSLATPSIKLDKEEAKNLAIWILQQI